MQHFHALIQGNGYPSEFKWIAVRFIGNTECKEVATFDTYIEGLAFKLRHKHKRSLILELWYVKEVFKFVGDEDNMLHLKENLTYFIW